MPAFPIFKTIHILVLVIVVLSGIANKAQLPSGKSRKAMVAAIFMHSVSAIGHLFKISAERRETVINFELKIPFGGRENRLLTICLMAYID